MKFLIQKINNKIVHDFSFTLLESVRFRNWLTRNGDSNIKVKYINTTNNPLSKSIFKEMHRKYVPIGSVEFVMLFLDRFYQFKPKPINVPKELLGFHFTNRKLFNGNEDDLNGRLFVKSNDNIKGITGIFNEDEGYSLPKGNYQFSNIISIDSEWRCFVFDGKLVGLQNYSGIFSKFPNIEAILFMIHEFKSAPIAYTLDVGVNDNGTFVIECHDFFSCGLYGFSDHGILPNMFHRWFREYIQKNVTN